MRPKTCPVFAFELAFCAESNNAKLGPTLVTFIMLKHHAGVRWLDQETKWAAVEVGLKQVSQNGALFAQNLGGWVDVFSKAN